MSYERLENNSIIIKPDYYVDFTRMGNIIEIKYPHMGAHKQTTKKISKNEYKDLKTGQIKEYQHHADNRIQSPESLRKTFKKIRQLAATNVTDANKVKFLTLTYRENMRDHEKLYKDFRVFNQNFCRYCEDEGLGKPEYISVAEPQKRGAWHLHVFYIWPYKVPYIPYWIFAYYWTHGHIDIMRLKNTDNIAGYMNAYLTNLEVSEEAAAYLEDEKVYTTEVDHQKKSYIKGARLGFYPANFNIYRHSQGIKKPWKATMSYAEALKRIEAAGLTKKYETCGIFTNDSSSFSVTIKKEEYRR